LRASGHFGQLGRHKRTVGGHQRPKHGGLLRRQFERVEPLGNRRGHGQQHRVARARLIAHAGRHHRLEHRRVSAEVVVGDPSGQPHHGRREQRVAVDHVADRLQRAAAGPAGFEHDAIADDRTVRPTQRAADPAANLDAGDQRLGHDVVKLARRPFGKDHRGHQPLGRVVLFPRRGLVLEAKQLLLLVGHDSIPSSPWSTHS